MISMSLRMRQLGTLLGLLLCIESILPSAAAAQPVKGRNLLEDAQARHRKRFQEFEKEIKKLAADCEEKGLLEAAKVVRSCDFVPDFQSLRINKLPTEARAEIPPGAIGDAWQKRLRHLEAEYAKDLFKQANLVVRHGFPSYAYNLIREAALHDPDNPQVRKVLGFVKSKNEWVTTFANSQMSDGKVWHNDYGWLPKTHLEKYIAGERYFRGRWISAEKEKVSRIDFNDAWEVRTDHYLIKTNVSLEKGVEMGKALEDFYGVFIETFAGFFNTPEQLQKLFEGKNNLVRANPYVVHFYRSREEYIERMKKHFPTIAATNGVYLTTDRVAHFYLDPAHDQEGTLFHEATHQLFYESDRANRTICDKHHFWIIEGIACYMESFERDNGSFSLGNIDHIRFVGARNNLLRLNYYVPLNRFTAYGMQEFQSAPQPILPKNYTQAAGLARFFMHYDSGRYREALVIHLTQLYSSRPHIQNNVQDLDILTGVEFSELDRQYAEDARAAEQQAAKN